MKRIVLAFAIAVAACNPSAPEKQEAPTPPQANVSIGFDGAAGIPSALPLTVAAVSAAAPGYEVAQTTGQIEGQDFPMLTLSQDGEVIFDVLPTADHARIHAITTRSPRARGPKDEIIGECTFGAAPATEVMFCASEYVEGAPGFACSNAQDGRFWRVYALPQGYDGPSEPFEGIDPDAALDATLAEMRWIAPR